MRVWIETVVIVSLVSFNTVTLRVRVWIETPSFIYKTGAKEVTLRVRVWIETANLLQEANRLGHPPREGVD